MLHVSLEYLSHVHMTIFKGGRPFKYLYGDLTNLLHVIFKTGWQYFFTTRRASWQQRNTCYWCKGHNLVCVTTLWHARTLCCRKFLPKPAGSREKGFFSFWRYKPLLQYPHCCCHFLKASQLNPAHSYRLFSPQCTPIGPVILRWA